MDEILEDFDERAAIMEFDGGLPRQEAEQKAAERMYVRYKLKDGSGGGVCTGGVRAELIKAINARYGDNWTEEK